jgi:hypothetical protein
MPTEEIGAVRSLQTILLRFGTGCIAQVQYWLHVDPDEDENTTRSRSNQSPQVAYFLMNFGLAVSLLP